MVAGEVPERVHISRQDLLQEALTFRSWGWSIIPLRGNKRPAVRWAPYQHRRASDAEIHRWFERLDDIQGIGVVTGAVSGGLAVRDFDVAAAYTEWSRDHSELASRCPTVRTRRGYHVYVHHLHRGLHAKEKTGEFVGDSLHFVVLPPSLHPSGFRYQWVGGPPLGPSELPAVTDPYTAGLVAPPPSRSPRARGTKKDPEKQQTVCVPLSSVPDLGELPTEFREAVLRSLPETIGQRNDKLFYLARCLKAVVPVTATAPDMYPVFVAWWRLAEPIIGTKDLGVSWAGFCSAWTRADPITASAYLGEAARVAGNHAEAGADTESVLIAACRSLAAQSPCGRFHLSCRTASTLAAVPYRTANRMLHRLVGSGFLIVTQQGVPSATKRKATEFRLGRS